MQRIRIPEKHVTRECAPAESPCAESGALTCHIPCPFHPASAAPPPSCPPSRRRRPQRYPERSGTCRPCRTTPLPRRTAILRPYREARRDDTCHGNSKSGVALPARKALTYAPHTPMTSPADCLAAALASVTRRRHLPLRISSASGGSVTPGIGAVSNSAARGAVYDIPTCLEDASRTLMRRHPARSHDHDH